MNILADMKKNLLAAKNINIVFIGDSITSTEWVHPNWREMIEYALKEELAAEIKEWKTPSWNIRCFNCGFDGSTTKDILGMLDDRILSVKPTIAIYIENTNDMHHNTTPEEHKKDVETLIAGLSKVCDIVILASAIPGDNKEYSATILKYVNSVKKIKFGKKTLFVNTFDEYSKYDLKKFFTFVSEGNESLGIKSGEIDFCHPNPLGNAYIAKIILEKVFRIKFNPEKYIVDTLRGEMFPKY